MISRSILFAMLLTLSGSIKAQGDADAIVGQFMTSKNDAIFQIYKTGDKYFGKIIWNKNEGKLDVNNPEVSKRTQPVKGMVILNNFIYKGSSAWEDGTIYDPKNGKTYSCKIKMDERKNLNVRGFIGISLLGRTEYFVRVNEKK